MSDNGSASTSIDIEDLCKQLVKEVTDSIQTTLQRPEICIYHVPVKFRRLNDVAYTPQIISIGPIHHNKNELQGMETQKRKYFKQFFDRLPEDKGEEREEFRGKLVSTIKDCEVKIRNCYQDEASKLCEDPKGFLKMILRDAAFILELFLKTREFTRDEKKSQDKYKYDYIIGKPWLAAAIHRDLILLENQLPFWILEKLYKLATEYIETDCLSFLELSCQYFETYNKSKNNPQKTLHFTDLIRKWNKFHLFQGRQTRKGKVLMSHKFHLLQGVQTWKGKVLISHMNHLFQGVHTWKGKVSHTVHSFQGEQKRDGKAILATKFVSRKYVKFLDFLVETGEDADLLIKSKVIINRLGESKAVSKLINNLCLEIVEDSSCYEGLATELNKYYKSTFNYSTAYLRRVYFKNVWIGTGTVVGLILLIINLERFVRSFF